MSNRTTELRELVTNHAMHNNSPNSNGKEFARLIVLSLANGNNIYKSIVNTYRLFPVTSGTPSVSALVELENFAMSRYPVVNLDKITRARRSPKRPITDQYLSVIVLMWNADGSIPGD